MTKALRGINLGGWLVAERWMTPDLFNAVINEGEIALVQELGREKAGERLKKHRDSFITENDFAWIAAHGFDFVRLPVGYWLFAETDDFIDGEAYLRQAFEWATIHGLGVVLDFHGLQGSQNGFDHSGQVGKVRLYRRHNRTAALETLSYMCRTYGAHERLIAVELINEPKVRWFLWRLMRYYDRAVAIAERALRPDVKIIVSDAFKPLRLAQALSRRGYSSRVVMDVHLYQVFSKEDKTLSYQDHMNKVDYEWRNLLQDLEAHIPIMVGEWSAALPAAAYDGHMKDEREGAGAYYLAQRNLFEDYAWAHSYWSYKTPGNGVWDFRSQSTFHR
jgi:glucan 1,3-beta-glucosidase